MTDLFALKCVERAATSHQNARPSSIWPNRARPQFPPLLQEYTLLLSHAKVFKISGQEKRPIGSVSSSRYSCTFFVKLRHASVKTKDPMERAATPRSSCTLFTPIQACCRQAKTQQHSVPPVRATSTHQHFCPMSPFGGTSLMGKQSVPPPL